MRAGRPGRVDRCSVDVQATEIDPGSLIPFDQSAFSADSRSELVGGKRWPHCPTSERGYRVRSCPGGATAVIARTRAELREIDRAPRYSNVDDLIGADLLEYSHPLYFGSRVQLRARSQLYDSERDFLLTIGCRMDFAITVSIEPVLPRRHNSSLSMSTRLKSEAGRIGRPWHVCDAKVFIRSLLEKLSKRRTDFYPEWVNQCSYGRQSTGRAAEYRAQKGTRIPMFSLKRCAKSFQRMT